MSDRLKLAREIAARSKPRFIEIPRAGLETVTRFCNRCGSNRVEFAYVGQPESYRERAKRYFEAAETSDAVLKESLIAYAERWLRMAADLEYAHDRVSQRHHKSEKIAV